MGESRARLETTERPSPFVYFFVKVYSVAANTFVEGVRQPVYAVIVGVGGGADPAQPLPHHVHADAVHEVHHATWGWPR